MAGRYLTPNPIVARPDTTLRKAQELLQAHQIRHLPVLQGKQVVEIIATNDLLRAMAEEDQSQGFPPEKTGSRRRKSLEDCRVPRAEVAHRQR